MTIGEATPPSMLGNWDDEVERAAAELENYWDGRLRGKREHALWLLRELVGLIEKDARSALRNPVTVRTILAQAITDLEEAA